MLDSADPVVGDLRRSIRINENVILRGRIGLKNRPVTTKEVLQHVPSVLISRHVPQNESEGRLAPVKSPWPMNNAIHGDLGKKFMDLISNFELRKQAPAPPPPGLVGHSEAIKLVC